VARLVEVLDELVIEVPAKSRRMPDQTARASARPSSTCGGAKRISQIENTLMPRFPREERDELGGRLVGALLGEEVPAVDGAAAHVVDLVPPAPGHVVGGAEAASAP
jgi:hypothetical protein